MCHQHVFLSHKSTCFLQRSCSVLLKLIGVNIGQSRARYTWRESICRGEGVLKGATHAAATINALCAVVRTLNSLYAVLSTAPCSKHCINIV